jgi:membrane protease subunit HflC
MSARLGATLLLVLLALAGLVAWRSVYVVGQGQSVLCTRLGRLDGGPLGPGLHVVSPLDQVHRFDQRIVTRTYAGESFLTAGQQPLEMDFYLKWRVRDVPLFYQTTSGDEGVAAQRLADLARDRLKNAVAHETLGQISRSARAGLGNAGLAALRADAGQFGLDLIDLQVQRIDLPDDAASAVYQRMEQAFTVQARQQDASGTLQAESIRAEADRKRADILADATRQAQQIRAQADARAAAIYAQAYGKNPEFAAFTQSLQAYRSSLGREGDILVITPQGDFFKYLQSPTGK